MCNKNGKRIGVGVECALLYTECQIMFMALEFVVRVKFFQAAVLGKYELIRS